MRRWAALWAPLFILALGPAAWATPLNEASPSIDRAEPEAFGGETPLGRVSYRPGQGLHVGDTGLVLGGFTTAEVDRAEGGDSRGELDTHLFVFLDPLPFVHLFSEVEFGSLINTETGQAGVRSDPRVVADRLYVDLGKSDTLNLRVGKFLTPFGRWNVAPADPLVWTTSEPLIVEQVFDDTALGAMLYGSVFPRDGALSYSLYGTFLDQLDADRGRHNAGAHLEWASLHGWTVGASYFASKKRDDKWRHLGGADVLWQPHWRVELSAEALYGEGSRDTREVFGAYAQAVVETVRTLYLVGRYERYDPRGARGVNLFDVGVAWVPVPYLRFKADYLFADHRDDHATPGFEASMSILF